MPTPGGAPKRLGDRWFVQVFGALRLHIGGRSLDHWPDSIRTRLLARLLLDPKPQPRDELAAWLWPVDRPRKGRTSDDPRTLRLTRLRNELKVLNGLLQADGLPPGGALLGARSVRLNPQAFSTELQQFDCLLRLGQLDDAAALLDRGLLPGLQDPWLDQQRQRLSLELQQARLGLLPPDDRLGVEAEPAPGFFGRARELKHLLDALQSGQRLMVIAGPGGCGKTRLAQQLLNEVSGYDMQAFVALAGHANSGQLLELIRDTLQIRPGPTPPLKQLALLLRTRRLLLVLDNFERFADEAGERTLAALLRVLPLLQLLLTTTRALRVPGCRELRLQPLPVPDAEADLRTARGSPAVELFLDQACRVRPGFKLTLRNRASVIGICRAVQGLPLAVELAAQRVRQVAPPVMAQALRESYTLLARTDPAALRQPRHASLQAVLDWCFSLLTPPLKDAAIRLAVMRGPFTAAQAAGLLAGGRVPEVLDMLVRECILSRHEEAGSVVRWSMLAAQREHAAVLGPESLRAELAQRHLAILGGLAAQALARRCRLAWSELTDLVAAGLQALDAGSPESAVLIALALARHAERSGTVPEVLDYLTRVAEAVVPSTPRHDELRAQLPQLFVDAGRAKAAFALAKRALAQAGNDPGSQAQALLAQTQAHWRAERDHAGTRVQVARCLRLARLSRDPLLQARVLTLSGAVKLDGPPPTNGLSDPIPMKAMAAFKAAGRRFRDSPDPCDALREPMGIAACYLRARNPAAALDLARVAEQQAEALDDIAVQLHLCNRQGEALVQLGLFPEALAVNRRQVRLAHQHGMNYLLLFGLWNQCLPLAKLGFSRAAAELMGFSQRYWVSHFHRLDAQDRAYVSRVRKIAIQQSSAAAWDMHEAHGAGMSLAEALRIGCA